MSLKDSIQLFAFYTWKGFAELEVKEMIKLFSAAHRGTQSIELRFNESRFDSGRLGTSTTGWGRILTTAVLKVSFWHSPKSGGAEQKYSNPVSEVSRTIFADG